MKPRIGPRFVLSPERAPKLQATRSLTPGKRTRIAEVTRPGGAKSQVFVTLR